MNLKMPELKLALEEAGFSDVKTLLSSGNVVFSGRAASDVTIERQVEAAIEKRVGKTFGAIVRAVTELQALLDADPFAEFRVTAAEKRVLTFLRAAPKSKLELPAPRDGARILCLRGRELLSAYVPGDQGPVFMTLIEKALGKDVTTRTWETVQKVARAGASQTSSKTR